MSTTRQMTWDEVVAQSDALLAENARLKEELEQARQERTCEWTDCGDGYSAACGSFCAYGHQDPQIKNMKRCFECGGKVVVKP